MTPDPLPISEHGAVGDLRTIALVGTDGAIDFLCWPRFDSPTVFARILDAERGGVFSIGPDCDGVVCRQMYLPETNVLLTRFYLEDGLAEITDFMPVAGTGAPQALVRRVKSARGRIPVRVTCCPAFDYARGAHRVERVSAGCVLLIPEDDASPTLRLSSDHPLRIRGDAVEAAFDLSPDDEVVFILCDAAAPLPTELEGLVEGLFRDTAAWWRRWVSRCTYRGRWLEMVQRSALVLKLLIHHEHGAPVAAATFGLPEQIGGTRNWDYRYTWIRDAAFTVYALIRLGFTDEARAFRDWLEGVCGQGAGVVHVMYGLDGSTRLDEEELTSLRGYAGSRPVRIGNAAHDQLQLDIYGELLDALYLTSKWGGGMGHDAWQNVVRMVEFVEANWQLPDEGIWEFRGGRHEFLHSRVMCWVALDRAVRMAESRSLPAPIVRWRQVRDQIYAEVNERFWTPERGIFRQHAGPDAPVDASSLLLPLMRFVAGTDPRWLSHLDALQQELVSDAFVHRYLVYRTPVDGLSGTEGSFVACSFWYVEALSRARRLDEARLLFEKMLGYANHLGLYAEELGRKGEHLGNFPQALSHLALVSAAVDLERRLSSERSRPWGG